MKIIFSILLCLIAFDGFSKPKDPFKQKIDSINYWLNKYDKINTGFIERYDETEKIQEHLKRLFLLVLNDQKILKYDLNNTFKNAVYITSSSDKRLNFISIDEKTGGSFHSTINIVHYRLRGGNVKAELFPKDEDDGLRGCGVDETHTMDSIKGIYLFISEAITCNTCEMRAASILYIEENEIHFETFYGFDGRFGMLKYLVYDPKTQTVSYEFLQSNIEEISEGEIPIERNFKGKFKYKNGEFVEIENCQYLIEK